jgi:hypothetical protein
MELRQAPGDGGHGRRCQTVHFNHAREGVGVAEATHLDGILDRARIAIANEAKAPPGLDDRAHAQVDVRCELPVYADLLSAGRVTP